MSIKSLIRLTGISVLALVWPFAFASVAEGQVPITFQGRVMYSTGTPVSGATVTMTTTVNGSSSTETTSTDGGGNYEFQTSRDLPPCNTTWSFQAFTVEFVDDEALLPSQTASSSGCVGPGIVTVGDLIIARPREITLGGIVRDAFGTPVQGLTVTMTRTKYDLEPDVVTTATTNTDGNGHYQFNTYARCSVVEDFRASIGNQVFQGGTSTSGCVLNDNDNLNFLISLGTLENAGMTPCKASVGRPVNVTNGNVYLEHTDYQLPAIGEALSITRTYNSISQRVGLFGRGWTSAYDEMVVTNANNQLELTLPDGQLVSFATPDFLGQVIKNGDGTYTVTFKDGRLHQFNTAGKLSSLIDRNGNQTLLSYDLSGRLSSITDSFNRVLNVTTNTGGRVLSISDSLGTVATYTYGGSNELLSVTYADGSKYQFAYVAVTGGLALSSVTDALGNVLEQHDYDSQGRGITSQAHGGVERYTLTYVSATETDVTDALGRVTRYFYHRVKSRLVVDRIEGLCSCGSGSQTQSWTYDNQSNVLSHTNALGHSASYTYDANGNQLSATGVLGTSSFTYNQFGEVLTANDAMGGVTTNGYDAAGNLLSVTDALSNQTGFTYNARGQLLTMTNALGKVTTLTWDTSGRVTQVTDALNNTTAFAYDARARLTSATNALNFITNYTYDAAGRVNKITRPDNTFITFTYDLAGRRTRFTDALNNSTSLAYDGAYRLTTATDADLKSVSYTYDLMSNLTGATDQLGRTTNIEYDEFNRPVKTTYPPAVAGGARLQETIEYDAVGNVTKRTDTAGRVTTFGYDNANRLVTVTDPALQVTQYEYNARSNLTAVTDALSQRYEFGHDALSRVISVTRAGMMMSFAYDAVGNRIQRTDYNNMSTNYTYDALNRLIKITYPDDSVVSYRYDTLSQLIAATNINGTVGFVYDSLGRVMSATDIWGQVLNYTYDANDRRTRMSFGTTTNATYTYDALNRLTKITDNGNLAITYAYDATSKVTSRTLPNGVATTFSYDGLGRLTRLKDAKGKTIIADNNYTYNNAGNITQNVDQSGPHTYAYDVLDRLTAATYTGAPNESYSYDGVGNRSSSHQSTSYSYQPFNRLTSTTAASYLYNNNGNMLSKSDASGTSQFAWDFENRMVQTVTPSAGSVSYKYDALGRLVQRVPSTGASTNFIYDGHDVVKDSNSDGSTVEYLNGPGIDNKIRQKGTTSKTTYYFTQDHLGSTTALTGTTGKLVERITYDGFGNSAGSAKTRYGFTGRERDSLTGLMYYRARFYDPQLGRFISEDPIGLAGGINQFAYVGNNPQNRRDPSGLYEIDVHYYLTYYLALRTGCFTPEQARMIAEGNQQTDEKEQYKPGPRRAHQNAHYHALHGEDHQPNLNALWAKANAGSGDYEWLGRYLHYIQDMFSHLGFTDPNWGHSPISGVNFNKMGTHASDKTDDNIERAQSMVAATWTILRGFGELKGCRCKRQWTPDMWPTINTFLNAPGGGFYDRRVHSIEEIDPAVLLTKIRLLGLPPR